MEQLYVNKGSLYSRDDIIKHITEMLVGLLLCYGLTFLPYIWGEATYTVIDYFWIALILAVFWNYKFLYYRHIVEIAVTDSELIIIKKSYLVKHLEQRFLLEGITLSDLVPIRRANHLEFFISVLDKRYAINTKQKGLTKQQITAVHKRLTGILKGTTQ